MRFRLNSTIHIVTSFNPHRYGVINWRRWNLLREGMTVADFLAANRAALGPEGHDDGRGYIHHAMGRNIITVDGVIATQTRAPRAIDASSLSPLSSDLSLMTFGVEIECILPIGLGLARAAELVTQGGVDCRQQMYGHDNATTRTWWKVVTDGSLRVDYSRGAEFVSPPLRGEEGLRQVEKVCQALLNSVKATITPHCGLHVHVGIGYADPIVFKRAVKLYADHETLLDGIQPESRRGSNNGFCRSLTQLEQLAYSTSRRYGPQSPVEAVMTATTREEIVRALSGAEPRGHRRYKKVNLASWWVYRTIEFRHHSGTVEADKASFWVKLCLRMMLFAQSNSDLPASSTIEGLLGAIGCSDDEQAFYSRRAAYFAARQTRMVA